MKLYVWNSEGFPFKKGSREIHCKSAAGVKKLLKERGGIGFTAVLDRKWNLAEKIPIVLEENDGAGGNYE
ncbi:MAG: hypothetical protein LBF80_06225 [Spirochaetaceae bacterium]|jgi:hypothetical protein|nr:hypothetical protein [Spirochaetaceae bacterium]